MNFVPMKMLFLAAVTATLLPNGVFAQEGGADLVPDSADGVAEGTQPGWHPMLKASANLSLGQTKNVPGSADGLSLTFGYFINGGLDYLSETKEHEWVNTLFWQLGYTTTPIVDALFKNADTIDFTTTYLYHFKKAPWFGPFVRFRLTTPMLPGYDVRPDDTNVLKLDSSEEQVLDDDNNPLDENGDIIAAGQTRVQKVDAEEKIELTNAFAPLTLRESVGFFAIPLEIPEFKLDIRLGFGAWETFAQGGYVVEDNPDTADLLELRQLQDPVQLGPELGVKISGLIKTNITYAFSVLLMQPVYHTAETDLEGLDLLNAEFDFVLGVKLWDYLSLDYMFRAYKQPLVVEDWQIQNGLMVSLTFSFFAAEEVPPVEECTCCPEEAKPSEP